ncbi:MAG TPA: MSMEG_0567/sll0787 family protein [Sporichthyaceae bacterium]|nr:MSMEG_0567/sll0787 family protein [Sporichthyaceae bacterium]
MFGTVRGGGLTMYQVSYRPAPVDGDGSIIAGVRHLRSVPDATPSWTVEPAADIAEREAYHRLRHAVFVEAQGLFTDDDRDEIDADPRTVVLVARDPNGEVAGGVRLGPVTDPDLGWWHGGRLVVRPGAPLGLGAELVRAACRHAVAAGVLRFEADVQARNERFFARLGWAAVEPPAAPLSEHVRMRYDIDRIPALVRATKAPLGALLAHLAPGGAGFVGDDGAPVPGSDLIAACDAILPLMVERDPWWAGWCSVLVNINDLAAMGAHPVGLLDAVGAADESAAAAVLAGITAAAAAYGVPVLGGHTTLGGPAFLAVTALGRSDAPVPGGGGQVGHAVRLTADLAGDWRPGYGTRQWDSTSRRDPGDLRAMIGAVAAARPAAAKDVSMAGLVGTLAMLAEASGVAAELDVAAVPRPTGASVGDWFTCFPGFAMLTTGPAGSPALSAGPAVSAECGVLRPGFGVTLRWPDGVCTPVLDGHATGLGTALTGRQDVDGAAS